MNRFIFSFDGEVSLTNREFFAGDVPEEITQQRIEDALHEVSVFDLLNDWNLADCLSVTLTDRETGMVWENRGFSWRLIRDRELLPGEQRLF